MIVRCTEKPGSWLPSSAKKAANATKNQAPERVKSCVILFPQNTLEPKTIRDRASGCSMAEGGGHVLDLGQGAEMLSGGRCHLAQTVAVIDDDMFAIGQFDESLTLQFRHLTAHRFNRQPEKISDLLTIKRQIELIEC